MTMAQFVDYVNGRQQEQGSGGQGEDTGDWDPLYQDSDDRDPLYVFGSCVLP